MFLERHSLQNISHQIDAAGLTEEVEAALPHLRHNIVPNRSKIAEDLENLAKQQEILAAEMKKYLAEDQVSEPALLVL